MNNKLTTPEILELLPKDTKIFMTDDGEAYVEGKDKKFIKIGQLNKKGMKTFEKWKEEN